MLTKENVFLAGIFIVLFLSALSSTYWHSFSYKQPTISIALYYFDKKAEDVTCAEVLLISQDTGALKKELRLYIDSKEMIRKNITIEENKTKKETLCADIRLLSEGKHFAEIVLEDKRLFYYFEKRQNSEKQFNHKINIISIEKDNIFFEVDNFPDSVYAPVEISVNGVLEKVVYPSKPNESFKEKIRLNDGKNIVEVSALGLSAFTEFEKKKGTDMLLFLGFLLLVCGVFVFSRFVFVKTEIFKRFAMAIFANNSLLILLGLILGFFKIFNLYFLALSYTSAIVIVALIFRKNFSCADERVKIRNILNNVSVETLVLLGFFLYICLFYQWFTPSHTTNFNAFYERGTKKIIENSGVPQIDEQSYLGRPFTFIPGYFYLEGAFSILLGIDGTTLFAFTSTLATIFFLFSSIAFAKAIGIKKAAIMLPIFLVMNTLIFTFITLTPRHIIAFSFLLVALVLFAEKKWPLASAAIFVGMLIQIPMALFYLISAIFIGLFINRGIRLKELTKIVLKPFLFAFAFFCIAYAMLFFRAGIPYQIMSEDWGYLIRFGPAILFVEPGILLFFFLLLIMLESLWLLRKETKLTREKKILILACFLAMAMQSAISQRFNVLSALFTALFAAFFLEYYKSKFTELFTAAIALLLMVGLYLALILVHGFTTNMQAQAGVAYLAKYSSDSERVLTDPLYGHVIEMHAGKKALADLMVEYADEQKLMDSYKFLKEEEYGILEKYNIALVFSERFVINEKVIGNEQLTKELEFKSMAKIFVNDKVAIHRFLKQKELAKDRLS
ncbi:MAG: EpsG family protein [Candidatus Diapherotrites archaeon]|nr:EpsG family protein [Candidatus Diapherotrites archaeon]